MRTMADTICLEISLSSGAAVVNRTVLIDRELPRVLDHKRASLLTLGNPTWKVASRTVMNREHTPYTCMQS